MKSRKKVDYLWLQLKMCSSGCRQYYARWRVGGYR